MTKVPDHYEGKLAFIRGLVQVMTEGKVPHIEVDDIKIDLDPVSYLQVADPSPESLSLPEARKRNAKRETLNGLPMDPEILEHSVDD